MLAELRHATDEWNMKKFWTWWLTTFGTKLGMSFWWSGNIIPQMAPLEKSRVFDTSRVQNSWHSGQWPLLGGKCVRTDIVNEGTRTWEF